MNLIKHVPNWATCKMLDKYGWDKNTLHYISRDEDSIEFISRVHDSNVFVEYDGKNSLREHTFEWSIHMSQYKTYPAPLLTEILPLLPNEIVLPQIDPMRFHQLREGKFYIYCYNGSVRFYKQRAKPVEAAALLWIELKKAGVI